MVLTTKLDELPIFLRELTHLMRKEYENLIPTCKMGIYYVSTTIFTKTAFN
ncbi:hypothetical protein JCM21738_3474 [Mesobacillus boroniphilus JCM 21738]|uniref:Uncharacterized protein n=1 Tax=Mesobacillus boroniphilus JCM 21738 TaxID=1294265 RepID=W4RQI4_9BACI|nr:hypothetical protein JCM21738_3474 [Mesobacillus boroniphilus JCM 21738]